MRWLLLCIPLVDYTGSDSERWGYHVTPVPGPGAGSSEDVVKGDTQEVMKETRRGGIFLNMMNA